MTSIIFFTLSFLFSFQTSTTPVAADGSKVIIEMVNAEDLGFDFSLTHKPNRHQILIRSAEPIKSFRLIDSHGKKETYNIIGSNLIVLPMTDFTLGDLHYLEFKFIAKEDVVLAKVTVPEDYRIDQ